MSEKPTLGNRLMEEVKGQVFIEAKTGRSYEVTTYCSPVQRGNVLQLMITYQDGEQKTVGGTHTQDSLATEEQAREFRRVRSVEHGYQHFDEGVEALSQTATQLNTRS